MDLKRLQDDPAAFRHSIRIDCDGKSKRLADVLDPFQDADFQRLDGGWKAVAGQPTAANPIRRAWLERPRGHSKTSDLAVMCCWVLFASKQRISGVAAAGDKDQARLLRDACETLVRQNPWLSAILDVQQFRVLNRHTGSLMEVISSDAPTSYGLLPSFVCLDEITHWPKRDLFDSLISSAAKKSSCMVVSICNAGFQQHWAWELREKIRNDPATWVFSRLEGPVASWITPENLAEMRKLLPLIQYRRLFENTWSAGSGTALNPDDVQRAITLSGPLHQPEPGWLYYCAVDLGLSRDRAACAVIGKHAGFSESVEKPIVLSDRQRMLIETGLMDEPEPDYEETFVEGTNKLKLVRLDVWHPADGADGKVQIEQIENTVAEIDQRFRLQAVGVDVWQAEYLVQRLQRRGIAVESVPFVPQTLMSMCSATLEAFAEHNIELFPDKQLIHDLHNLKIEERSYGCRLVSPRGPAGHGDSATAMSLSLHLCRTKTAIAAINPSDKLLVY